METCNVVLTFESVDEIRHGITIQMKSLLKFFRLVLFVVVLSGFEKL